MKHTGIQDFEKDGYFKQSRVKAITKFARTILTSNSNLADNVKYDNRLSGSSFMSLPIYLKLRILGYLNAEELCIITSVNKDFYELSNDEVLWHNLYTWNYPKWHVIRSNANPLFYQEDIHNLSWKDIYLRCTGNMINKPEERQEANTGIYNRVLILFRSMLRVKNPRIVLFGPGIETCSGLVRKILAGTDIFNVVGVFPGMFGGIGSGFTMEMADGKFDLIVLYSATKKERTSTSRPRDRIFNNRFFIQNRNAPAEEGGHLLELNHSVCELCLSLDALVYCVNADSMQPLDCCKEEMFALCNERWTSPKLPLVVLSCIKDSSVQRTPCVEVVRQLDISSLTRPWQVHDVIVSNMSGFKGAFKWLLHNTHR